MITLILQAVLTTALFIFNATWLCYHGVMMNNLSAMGWVVCLLLLGAMGALVFDSYRELGEEIKKNKLDV